MRDSLKIQFVLVAGAMLSAHGGVDGTALTRSPWPEIVAPKEVRLFDIGEEMTINGLPMRLQGFIATTKLLQLADSFRLSLGQPRVEDRLGDKLILGRMQGEYYLTVELESAGAGTRGVIAVTHLRAAYDGQLETQFDIDHRQSRLPSGSRLINQVNSQDGGKLAQHSVIVNDHNMELNLERVKELMREDGYALQYEAGISGSAASSSVGPIATGKFLSFKDPGREAMAVIYGRDSGGTTIVLNTVKQMEHFK